MGGLLTGAGALGSIVKLPCEWWPVAALFSLSPFILLLMRAANPPGMSADSSGQLEEVVEIKPEDTEQA